jgi:hypothetical protein
MFVHDQQLTATWAYVFDLQLDYLLIHKQHPLGPSTAEWAKGSEIGALRGFDPQP